MIGLLFYKIDDLKLDNYNSYLDLIQKNTHLCSNLIYPFIVAVIYTFGYPNIRNWIIIFNAFTKAWGNRRSLKASKDSMISIEKFIALRKTYEQRTLILEDIINKESGHVVENEKLTTENLDLKHTLNDTREELVKWKTANDAAIMNGTWELHSRDPLTNEPLVDKFHIQHGTFQILSSFLGGEKTNAWFRNFYRNPQTGQITFTLMIEITGNNTPHRSYHLYVLDPLNDGKILRGRVDEKDEVEFRKITD